MSRTLELPEPIYQALMDAASASGVAPADWIAARLVAPPSPGGAAGGGAADLRRLLDLAGSIRSGNPSGADNESIDADLARSYMDTHEGPS